MEKVKIKLFIIVTLLMTTGCSQPSATPNVEDYKEEAISLGQAKQIVFHEAGVISADVHITSQNFDEKNFLYNFRFIAQNIEYKYAVHADTGDIKEVTE